MDAKELLELAASFSSEEIADILETLPDDIDHEKAGDVLGHLLGEDLDQWTEFSGMVKGSLEIREASELFAEHSADEDKRGLIAEFISDGFGPDSFEEAYSGEWKDFEEFARDFADSCDIVPRDGTAANYFYYGKFANDLEHDYHTIERGRNDSRFSILLTHGAHTDETDSQTLNRERPREGPILLHSGR